MTKTIEVQVTRDPSARDLPLPTYATHGAAGMDLRAAVALDAPVVIPPGEWRLVPTGLRIALPDGYEAQIRPRSGLALKHGIGLLNSPGTIDHDYRGEVGVILINHGRDAFTVNRGDRIAQVIIAKYERIEWNLVEELPPTSRGGGGFGHTGQS